MINPRDFFIRAHLKQGASTPPDYFSSASPLELGVGDDKDIDKLVDYLSLKDQSLASKGAFDLFNNWENRIFIEGLLFSQGIAQVKKLSNIDPQVLDFYNKYLFRSESFSLLHNKLTFLSTINVTSVRVWFENCMNKNIQEINHIMVGDRSEVEPKEALKRLLSRSLKDFESFCALNPSEVLQKEEGISKSAKELYTLGLAAGNLARSICATLALDAFGKTVEESRLDTLFGKITVEKEDSVQFTRSELSQEVALDLENQFNTVNPLARKNYEEENKKEKD